MQFFCDGADYDSDDMLCPPIDDPDIIMLFITHDLRCVFGVSTVSGEGTKVRRIDGGSLTLLADRTQIPELIEAARLLRHGVRV